jgi:hypothetical protein
MALSSILPLRIFGRVKWADVAKTCLRWIEDVVVMIRRTMLR